MSEKNEKLGFSKSLSTKICNETPMPDNAFVAQTRQVSGYNILDISQKLDYIETLFLLFKLELPTPTEKKLLTILFNFLSNLGPRHPAIRAAMTAGVSKANVEHLLPIGLMTLGGENGGATEVEKSYQFIAKLEQNTLPTLFDNLNTQWHKRQEEPQQGGDLAQFTPGFGSRFNQIDPIVNQLANQIHALIPDSPSFNNVMAFVKQATTYNIGWLESGIAAAVFYELNIGAREAAGLFQLACAPGILAHGVEQTHKPITAMPLLEDSQYELRK